jgi:hypothetical protein
MQKQMRAVRHNQRLMPMVIGLEMVVVLPLGGEAAAHECPPRLNGSVLSVAVFRQIEKLNANAFAESVSSTTSKSSAMLTTWFIHRACWLPPCLLHPFSQ